MLDIPYPRRGLPHVDDAHLQLDTRIIHSYGSLSKLFYKAMWKNRAPKDLKETPHFAYGAVPHMRREQAISVRMIAQHRLRTAGWSSAMKFYDVKNAFPSPSHDVIAQRVRGHNTASSRHSRQLIIQHVTEHECEIDTCDASLLLRSGSGVPQGSTLATGVFNPVYGDVIGSFGNYLVSRDPMLYVQPPVSERYMSLANTLFVDDLGTQISSDDVQQLWAVYLL